MRQTYSLHSKTIDVIDKARTSNYTPGPGTYDSIEFDGSSCSKYGKSKFGKIDPHNKRFLDIKQSPGPSTYENEDGKLGTGHYKLARHIGQGGRVFGR